MIIQSIADSLRAFTGPATLVVGVGNRLRGDDAAGPLVIDRLRARGVRCLDCGVAPENYLEKIVAERPDTVLFVDAVAFGGDAGDVRLFNTEEIARGRLSTHGLSLQMTSEYIASRIPVRIMLLGICPQAVALGEEVSEKVKATVQQLADMLVETGTHA